MGHREQSGGEVHTASKEQTQHHLLQAASFLQGSQYFLPPPETLGRLQAWMETVGRFSDPHCAPPSNGGDVCLGGLLTAPRTQEMLCEEGVWLSLPSDGRM